MKEFITILKKTVLFSGVKENEIEAMLSCLQARKFSFKKRGIRVKPGAKVG